MFRQSLGLIFAKESKSHIEFKSLFLQPPFLAHLNGQITLIKQLMDEITLDVNINVSNAAILLTLNGIAPSIPVEPAIKWHQDMHLGHVEDEAMTTESVVITTLMDTTMETSWESVEKHMIGS
jgi:hypothetical protein